MNWFGEIPDDFDKYFGSWVRFEPRARADDFSQGLEARIADPLWMLARQWQMGEFQGEDNGSPVRVNLEYQNTKLDRVYHGFSNFAVNLEYNQVNNPHLESLLEGLDISLPLDQLNRVRRPKDLGQLIPNELGIEPGDLIEKRSLPLETIVECEEVPMDWRSRIRIGQQFERFLRHRLGDKAVPIILVFRSEGFFPVEYPEGNKSIDIDYATERFLKLVSGKSIDGGKLMEAINNNSIPVLPENILAETGEAALQQVYNDLIIWSASLNTQPKPSQKTAWQGPKLESRFRTGSRNQGLRLVAPDYRSGEPDWYVFDIQSIPSNIIGARTTKYFNPTRVGFPSKPNERWWTFEDHRIDFGNLEAGATDIVKLILMEFALIYGDDWYLIPLEVPAGSVTKIVSLKVTNVFGEVSQSIPVARNTEGMSFDHWDLFSLTGDSCADKLLLAPPPTGYREESSPLQEVRFIRDEGANMVFAIEHTVQNMLGAPVPGFEAQLERKQREAVSREKNNQVKNDNIDSRKTPRYRLASVVPENWIPYVPVNTGQTGFPVVKLRQALMLRNDGAEQPTEIQPMSRLLSDPDTGSKLEWINEESVPRSGVKVQLTKQRMRWIDGRTYIWFGRKAEVGRGERSSGLKFDYLEYEK